VAGPLRERDPGTHAPRADLPLTQALLAGSPRAALAARQPDDRRSACTSPESPYESKASSSRQGSSPTPTSPTTGRRLRRNVKILALEIAERETILAAFEDAPPDLAELPSSCSRNTSGGRRTALTGPRPHPPIVQPQPGLTAGDQPSPDPEHEDMSLILRRWRTWISPAARRGRKAQTATTAYAAWVAHQRELHTKRS
jgi:hypothetical protein